MNDLVTIGSKSLNDGSDNRRPGVYIKTFGCQMNEYDSLKLLRILSDGYQSVDQPQDAELILINTCSVREKPEHKLYSLLGEMRELKAQKPELLIGVGGCVAQQEGERIVKRSSVVDFVFGTHNLSLVPALIKSRQEIGRPQVAVDYRDEWEELPLGLGGASAVSAPVSISRGCNKNCTYCIVPTTRGVEVSRDPEEILREVRIAVHRGAREVLLLGQTVNSYGRDLSPRLSFVELVNKISEVDGLRRIRFTSPHPQEVRSDFISLLKTNPKVCRHIHMPLQSGSDRILKAMNRNYRRKKYLAIIDALKEAAPDIGLTTDIIVGFPGESERDFEQTLEIMDLVEFHNSYSFMFSPRPGTVAASLKDSLSQEEKLDRLKILQAKQDQITSKFLQSWVSREVEVLLDGTSHSDATCLQGRTSQNITLNLVSPESSLKPGMTIMAKVIQASRYTLRGELIRVENG